MQNLLAALTQRGIRPLVIKALAVKPRGCVANDRLVLNRVSGQLQLEWHARDVHPWDRDLPPYQQAELYLEQALRDAEEVIHRLFGTLPEIEQIEIRVLDTHDCTKVILAGIVAREDALLADMSASRKMRLKMMGVQYGRIVDAGLEPLSIRPMPVPGAVHSAAFASHNHRKAS